MDPASVADMMSIWPPWAAQSLMRSVPARSNRPLAPGIIVQQATSMTSRFVELHGTYIDNFVEAVRQRDVGLAGVVSDGALGIATMISLVAERRG